MGIEEGIEMGLAIGTQAKYIRDTLVADGILDTLGKIQMSMLGVNFEVEETSAIGYMIQDWLEVWMDKKQIFNEKPDNTQEAPDFFLNKDHARDLLEVKCFTGSPGFDLSNFDSYTRLIHQKPEHLFADYLVFEYQLSKSGLKIVDISLLKIWDMTRAMRDYPLNVQKKRQGSTGPQKVYNIRPADWRAENVGLPIHRNYETYLKAISEVIKLEEGAQEASKWLTETLSAAKKYLAELK
jgi:hypothetical protein